MLINILDSIFTENKFIKKEINFKEYSCHFYHNISKSDFFILIDKKSITLDELDLLEKTGLNELDEILKQNTSFIESYTKNTTLILCINSNEEIENNDLISSIEEDKYLFKKNIIFYSEYEVDELQKLFNGDYTQKQSNNILQTTGLFEKLKTDRNGGFALLARLFIKLPFLHLATKQIDLDNLSDKIEEEAQNQNVHHLYNLNQKSIDNTTISSYKDLLSSGFVMEIKDEL